ncbi:MAG TPA: hypothetical protein VF587_12605 [Solirubrobacteraceae bacterium]
MRRVLALSVLALTAGCGGGDEDDAAGPRRPPSVPAPAPAAGEAVVRAWAADLRRGDVDAAASRFAVPSVVQNGGPAERLTTRLQVRSFNASLPCGGRVSEIKPHAGVLLVTFVLTERPGGACGAGAGGTASTAFDVRDGRIVRWIRVPERGEPQPPTGDPA